MIQILISEIFGADRRLSKDKRPRRMSVRQLQANIAVKSLISILLEKNKVKLRKTFVEVHGVIGKLVFARNLLEKGSKF